MGGISASEIWGAYFREGLFIYLFYFVLFCFVLFCFVLFCFVLFCFVLFCFVLFCFVLFCFVLFYFIFWGEGGGGGFIIGILRHLTRATSSYRRKKAGFFLSSFTAKNTYSTEKSDDEEAENHEASTDKEIQELTDAVMKTFSLEHPIIFDKCNICKLVCQARLSKFSIRLLHEICTALELGVSSIRVSKCSCYSSYPQINILQKTRPRSELQPCESAVDSRSGMYGSE